MERAPIIAVLDGSADSLEAVRWAAWQSQETDVPLEVVHAYAGVTARANDAQLKAVHESFERSRATQWLQEALDDSPALPSRLRLVVAVGSLEEVVGQRLQADGLLVVGAHAPAGLVSWCSRVRRSPVVLVPVPARAAARPEDGTTAGADAPLSQASA